MTTHTAAPDPNVDAIPAPRRLRRSVDDRMLTGVAAGVAAYLGADVMTVRIAIGALALLGGAGVPLYIAAMLLIPEEGRDTSIAEDLLDRAGLR